MGKELVGDDIWTESIVLVLWLPECSTRPESIFSFQASSIYIPIVWSPNMFIWEVRYIPPNWPISKSEYPHRIKGEVNGQPKELSYSPLTGHQRSNSMIGLYCSIEGRAHQSAVEKEMPWLKRERFLSQHWVGTSQPSTPRTMCRSESDCLGGQLPASQFSLLDGAQNVIVKSYPSKQISHLSGSCLHAVKPVIL